VDAGKGVNRNDSGDWILIVIKISMISMCSVPQEGDHHGDGSAI
jgi:hypothetical protein